MDVYHLAQPTVGLYFGPLQHKCFAFNPSTSETCWWGKTAKMKYCCFHILPTFRLFYCQRKIRWVRNDQTEMATEELAADVICSWSVLMCSGSFTVLLDICKWCNAEQFLGSGSGQSCSIAPWIQLRAREAQMAVFLFSVLAGLLLGVVWPAARWS